MRDVLEGACEQLGLAVARDLTQRPVDAEEVTLLSDERHPDGCVVEGPAEPLFRLLQRALRDDALGDVFDQSDGVDRLAVRVANDRAPDRRPDRGTVRA